VAVAVPAPDVVVRAAENVGVKDYAQDPAAAARLWDWSAQLTGVDAFA
jgi:protochlorophyllide reductase